MAVSIDLAKGDISHTFSYPDMETEQVREITISMSILVTTLFFGITIRAEVPYILFLSSAPV